MSNEQVAISNEQAPTKSARTDANEVGESGEQVTINNEQITISNEQLAISNGEAGEQSDTVELSDAAELPAIADPQYTDMLSVADNPARDGIRQPESASEELELTKPKLAEIAAEEKAPAQSAEPLPPPVEPAPKQPPPAVTGRRTAQNVPPLRESWRQPPAPVTGEKDETPEIAKEPSPNADYQFDERVPQPSLPITFSRVARATVGQLVEIPFRGTDWVFLGEIGARRGIAYDSRRVDTEGDNFIFRVEASGVYALKFYRQDFARDFILNDHVQIIAGSAPETTGLGWFNPPIDRSRVVAGPRWPNFHEEAVTSVSPPAAAIQPAIPAPVQPQAQQPSPAAVKPPAQKPAPLPALKPSAPIVAAADPPAPKDEASEKIIAQDPVQPPAPPASPDSILKEAREEYNAGRIASAITLLDQFRKLYPSGSDEAWWLYGQCYEANGPNRNILAALDYYRRLVREYPQSSRLTESRRRISYLERYYININ